MSASKIELVDIVKRFGNVTVLDRVNLTVEPGEFMVFIGPSGSGKSSMMRIIAGLDSADSGEVNIDGADAQNLAPADRRIAMVFQNYALYPHMTVAENMGFSLKMAGKSRAEIEASVRKYADMLRIGHLLERRPSELSGGQRQRVAIGRALVRRPKVFLFDEPLSNLDPALREEMRVELIKLHRELGTTMIYVTHDQTEAMTMGDRIAVFNHGKVEQVGTPLHIYREPDTSFVAGVLGSPKINLFNDANLLEGLSRGKSPSGQLASPAVAVFGVRPEGWEIGESGAWPVAADVVENLGDCVIVHARPIDGQSHNITLRLGSGEHAGLKSGDTFKISPLPGAVHCFDNQGMRIHTH